MTGELNKQDTCIAASADAWVLPLRGNLVVAVGALAMMHIIPEPPVLFEIPRAPSHCRQVIIWEDAILPLVDLAILFLGVRAMPHHRPERVSILAAVIGSQAEPEQRPQCGALLLNGVPARTRVNDEQVCELPATISDWRGLALSCFRHPQYGPVPILNLTHLFTANLHEDPLATT